MATVKGGSGEMRPGRAIPHPTSLREATFSHKWEKGRAAKDEATAAPLTLAIGAKPSQIRPEDVLFSV